ncbi:GntR family transcriptional regulator [Roseomonas sp. GCM10028921]
MDALPGAAGADARLPLHARLRDLLAARLAAGEWPPGTALPAESKLAVEYRASLQTMRRAIGHLEQEGLVYRQHGRGTFSRPIRGAGSMLRFFRVTDAQAGNDAILPESRTLASNLTPLPADAARRLKRRAGEEALCLSRLRSWDGAAILYETIHLPLPEASPLLDLKPEGYGALLYPLLQERCGLLVMRAEDEITVAQADEHAAAVLRIKPGDPLIVAQRTAYDESGRPVEARLALGRADRFRYHATAT